MRRVTALWVGAALMAAARLVPAGADTTPPPAPTPDLPQFLCPHGITDIDKDAVPQYVPPVSLAGGTYDTSAVYGDNPALDIRAVNLRLTPTDLEVFMALQGDPTTTAFKSWEVAWRYEIQFTLGSKTFDYGFEKDATGTPGSSLTPASPAAWEPRAVVTPAASGNGTVANTTAKFVSGGSGPTWLVVTSPRDEVEKQSGPITNGVDVFKNIVGTTTTFTSSNEHPTVDTTSATGTAAQYTAGDGWCFGQTTITSIAAPAAVYHHSTALSATLLDRDGNPVAGQKLTFTVKDGKSAALTGTTDESGVATVNYGPIAAPAGTYPVTVAFAGEGTSFEASTAVGKVTVTAQKSAFTALKVTKPSAIKRTVTTTLLDDLKKPIAGVHVDWYVNGKKVASVTTDKTGRAAFGGAKAGQKVQARFAGKSGYWLASVSATVKVS
jgi:hypothetical protein